ncbi:MAG: hypothetical protein RBS68_01920 [Anaerolineales bacterium]|jgi:hypothetical protein|nr:hypothetical protein [Anaerolineales bacterium]
MIRKILSGALIGLSALFFLFSLVGIGAVWFYKAPLTRDVLARIQGVDSELELAQSSLKDARLEIERTLRIVESAEQTLAELKDELSQARAMFGIVDGNLEGQMLPGLQETRKQISEVVTAVEEIRISLQQINDIPFLNLNLPGDDLLAEIISIGVSLDKQIVDMEGLAEQAAVFLKDASYLMGGDMGETIQNLQNFQLVIVDYEQKLGGWRTQLGEIRQSFPGWVQTASIALTVFLLWFAFSQLGLFWHGLNFWRGGNPLAEWRRV